MTYCTKEEIRNLTGLTEVEVSDDQLDQIIEEAKNLLDTYTGQPWYPSDTNYSKIQTVTRFIAISLAYESLPQTPEVNEKAQRYHEKALRMLDALRGFETGFKVVQG